MKKGREIILFKALVTVISLEIVDETRLRGRRFHMVSCQKLSQIYQFGELREN